MNTPKVSIIVPTYNGGHYLELLLDSILKQTFSDFEVLILDDCSTDNSWDVMSRYNYDTRFRIFQWKPNRGAHAGTFFLLSQMRGEFWCYPGADDLLESDFLEKRCQILQNHPNCTLVHGRAKYIDQDGKPTASQAFDIKLPFMMSGRESLEHLLECNHINAPSVMVRSSVTKLVLPQFCGTMFFPMDWYLWILIASTGFDFAYDDTELHSYRVHLTSNTLNPAKQTVRLVEIRLVPLLALSKASCFSDYAMDCWGTHKNKLFMMSLFRCWLTRKSQNYNPAWLRLAFVAVGKTPSRNPSVALLRNWLGVIAFWKSVWRRIYYTMRDKHQGKS